MANHSTERGPAQPSRRDFLKNSTIAVTAGSLAANLSLPTGAFAGEANELKVGLIGCGGRGTGAAKQALNADKNVKLVAMADAFPDRLEKSLATLRGQEKIANKISVADDMKFVGFDAYKQMLATDVDVVLLTTPPHFRPAHLKAAVAAGKHIFCEKPVAVDAPGVRSVIDTCEAAKQKNLSVVSGLCWRYHNGMRATFDNVLSGGIGDIATIQCTYNTSGLWNHKRESGWSDMEWQLRNWLYFTWLSGDHIVEQHIHSLDKMAWVMGDEPPVKVTGVGGRTVRDEPEYGHIYDNFSTVYEYANGVKGFCTTRQQNGCDNNVTDHIMGTKGVCDVFKHKTRDHAGKPLWRFEGKRNNMYQAEHDEFFASIRGGEPINNGEYMTRSTLIAIMGRMSAYTGKTITWEQAMNSKENLSPEKYDWISMDVPPVAMPGVTQFS